MYRGGRSLQAVFFEAADEGAAGHAESAGGLGLIARGGRQGTHQLLALPAIVFLSLGPKSFGRMCLRSSI
jgi:hypothetical protein